MDPHETISIELVSLKEIRIQCDGEWRTIRTYDKGFTEAKKLFRIVRIAHGIACGCTKD